MMDWEIVYNFITQLDTRYSLRFARSTLRYELKILCRIHKEIDSSFLNDLIEIYEYSCGFRPEHGRTSALQQMIIVNRFDIITTTGVYNEPLYNCGDTDILF